MTLTRSLSQLLGKQQMSKYYKRTWLNKKEGTAFIECMYEGSFGSHNDCSVKFGDCHRTSSIDFSFFDKKTKAERVAKLSSIIDELLLLKEHMEKAELKK
jgi:hypothetical protein